MVLHHDLYIVDTVDKGQAETVNESAQKILGELAKRVAGYFVKHFGFNVEDQNFLFDGKEWMDPGPILDLSVPYTDWDNTPVRRKSRKPRNEMDDTGPTLQDIITQNWIPPSLRGPDKAIAGSSRTLRSKSKATCSGKA
jgi:hypothetical protein